MIARVRSLSLDRVSVLLLILFLITNNLIWYGLGATPQHWDSAIHSVESLNASRIGEDPTSSHIHQILSVSWYYPPFVSYVSAMVYRVLGETEFAGFQVMTLFLLVLVLSTYSLGLRLYGRLTGTLAALFLSVSPIVTAYSRTFMLDLPLASMVALSAFLLVRAGNFRGSLFAALLGVALGCGLLTKWTFPLFLVGPFAFYAWKGLKDKPGRRRVVGNILLALVIAILISLPWYLEHIVQILTTRSGELGRSNETFFQGAVAYLTMIPGQASWLVTLVLIAGLVLYIRKFRFSDPMLILWFIAAYVLISLVGFRIPRFSISLLIPLALLAGAGFQNWLGQPESIMRRRRVVAAACGILVVQYLTYCYIAPDSGIARILSSHVLGTPLLSSGRPWGASWNQTPLLDDVDRDRLQQKKSNVVVRVIPDYDYFNNATVNYYAQLRRLPFTISGTSGFPLFTDYVIVKTGNVGLDSPERTRGRLTQEILSDTAGDSPMFLPLGHMLLPDGSEAIAMRVQPQPVRGLSESALVAKVEGLTNQFVARYFRPLQGYAIGVEPGDSGLAASGALRSIRVKLASAEFGDFAFKPLGMKVSDIDLEIEDVVLNPKTLVKKNSLEILSIGRLNVRSFDISAADLRRYIEESSNGKIRIDSLQIHDGAVSVAGSSKALGAAFALAARLSLVGGKNMEVSFDGGRFGFIPLPGWLLNALTDAYNPLIRSFGGIREVEIAPLTLAEGRLKIGDARYSK